MLLTYPGGLGVLDSGGVRERKGGIRAGGA